MLSTRRTELSQSEAVLPQSTTDTLPNTQISIDLEAFTLFGQTEARVNEYSLKMSCVLNISRI